jgi:RHS repeat-associated protein
LDNVGNILTDNRTEPYTDISLPAENVSYEYNNANRITKAGNTSFSFDSNGNTKSRGSSNYNYDDLDKLISSNDGSVFEYDALGNIRRNGNKRYWIDIMGMGNVIAETDLSDNPTAYYIYGAGGLEARILPNNDTEYYVSDYRGSVVAMVDATTSANIISKYQYDEFGNLTQYDELGHPNPFRYVGKYGVMYANDNLYYMRARFYDPTIGRFLSEDPIWSTNLYPYAGNNPVMRIDPIGRGWSIAGPILVDEMRFLAFNQDPQWKDWVEFGGGKILDIASDVKNIKLSIGLIKMAPTATIMSLFVGKWDVADISKSISSDIAGALGLYLSGGNPYVGIAASASVDVAVEGVGWLYDNTISSAVQSLFDRYYAPKTTVNTNVIPACIPPQVSFNNSNSLVGAGSVASVPILKSTAKKVSPLRKAKR